MRWALGAINDPEGRTVLDGLQVSASTKTLQHLCEDAAIRFQCFSGYAGWAPGQLEQEISEGSWILAPVDPELVLATPPDDLWLASLTAIGIDLREVRVVATLPRTAAGKLDRAALRGLDSAT